jgi:hypothetical protein
MQAAILAFARMMITRQLLSLAAVGFFLAAIIGEVRQEFARVGSLARRCTNQTGKQGPQAVFR